jgi:hypothetical protein
MSECIATIKDLAQTVVLALTAATLIKALKKDKNEK